MLDDNLTLYGIVIPILCLITLAINARAHKFSQRVIIYSIISPIIFLVTILITIFLPHRIELWSHLPFVVILLVMCIIYTSAVHVNIFRRREASVANASKTMIIWSTFILVWELAANKFILINPIYFPPPSKIAGAFFQDAATFRLFILSTRLSAQLLYTGYAIGSITGTFAGLMIGWSRHVENISVPIVKVVAPIPATAWIPIAIVTFPDLNHASLFVLWIAAFFPALFNTYGGVKALPKHHVEMAKVLGANDITILKRVVIPYAMPAIFIGLYFALILDLISLIPAEMVGVQAGIGWFMSYARGWSQYDLVYANVILIGLISLGTLTILDRVQSRLLRWQRGVLR